MREMKINFIKFSKSIFKKSKKQDEKYVLYKEQDTECDNCKYLNDCIINGGVFDNTLLADSRTHYGRSLRYTNSFCKAEKEMMLLAADKIRAESECEFCKDIPIGLPLIETDLYIAIMNLLGENTLVYSNCGDERGAGALKINFCPMCGRKLI
jgi:hypothetical protein